MHVSVRICVGVSAVLLLGSALAEGLETDSGRSPVYRERGIVSSVPLGELEKSGAWTDPSSEGEWKQYLSKSRKVLEGLGPNGTNLTIYTPIRCLTDGLSNDKSFCIIPINVTEVVFANQKWICKVGVAGVVYGDGSADDKAGGIDIDAYQLSWKLVVDKSALKGDAKGVSFGGDGIEVKFNHRTDKPQGNNPPKAIELYKISDSEFHGAFKKKIKKITAFYYDINLLVDDGSGTKKPCNPLDPVVVNTD